MKKILAVLILFCAAAVAQTPVNLGTYPQFVSLLQNGQPNAFGCVFTYAVNSTTPLATYVDYTGTTLNANPVVLSAGGTANIWFQNGLIYTVVIKSSGGVNCVSGTTILTVNGVNGTLLNSQNEWFASQTFAATTYFTLSDLQLVFGSPSGTQTTLDVVPQSANYILHTPTLTGNDTLVTQNATQALTNKNLTTGTEINGCGVTNGPATYICIPNNTSTASLLNGLAILTGAPSTVTVAPLSTPNPIVGIVVAGAGISGTAVVQQSGEAACIFDGATTAGDAIQLSTGTAGECHDTGSPLTTGSLGIVLSTNTGSGTYNIALTAAGGGGSAAYISIANAGSTGTTLNTLTSLTGAPSAAVIETAASIGGSIGITIANPGTTGTAVIQQTGLASCIFDAATTAGDYVTISTGTNGDCTDAGASYPRTQLIGRVLSTNGSAGTYELILFPPEIGSHTIFSGSSLSLSSTSIAAGQCTSVYSTPASAGDSVEWAWDNGPTSGYLTGLIVYAYNTSGSAGVKACNPTGSPITSPSLNTINLSIIR